MSDHYNLLGVPPEAGAEELRRAYRREAKRCHPDLHVHRPPAEREELQRRFIELARAYEVLSSPELRAAYDRQRAAERPSPRSGAMEPGTGPRATAPSPPRSGAPRAASPSPTAQPRGRKERHAAEQERAAPDVGRIRREAEQSLAAFGLDLRFPGEATLEQLLDWARRLYRDWAGAVRPSAAKPTPERMTASGPAQSGARQPSDAHSAPRPERDPERSDATHPPRQGGAGSASARSAAALSDPDVERELARLKRDLRSGSGRAAHASTVDDELAELKRKHGRRPPR